MTSLHPDWMLDHPEPQIERRKLIGVEMEGWLGYVPLTKIEYWLDNRRTDVQVTRLKQNLSRVPSDDDLYNELIGDPDLDIEGLARDILRNDLRNPLIMSDDGVLLDGNRRYLAHRWIADHAQPHERDQFNRVKAWVLKPEYSDERGKLRVVTQYNFLYDFRKQWKDYVKAKLLWEDYNDGKRNYTYNDLVEIYGGPGFRKGKIIEFIKTYEIIIEFVESSPNPDEAVMIAAENFIWFQQLQRSYRDWIRNDEEFQEAIFGNIRNGYVEKTDDLKNLRDVRNIKDAWVLFKRGDIEAAHLIRQNVQAERSKYPDPNILMARVNSFLGELLTIETLDRISDEALTKFHELAEQVPGQVGDVNKRISYIVQKLEVVTSIEIESVSDESISNLRQAISRLVDQAQATKS